MLYREIITVCSQIHTKHINTVLVFEPVLTSQATPKDRRTHTHITVHYIFNCLSFGGPRHQNWQTDGCDGKCTCSLEWQPSVAIFQSASCHLPLIEMPLCGAHISALLPTLYTYFATSRSITVTSFSRSNSGLKFNIEDGCTVIVRNVWSKVTQRHGSWNFRNTL